MILPADLLPKRAVGPVAALAGPGGAVDGVDLGRLAGQLQDHGCCYAPLPVMAGSLPIIAFLVMLTFVCSLQPLPAKF